MGGQAVLEGVMMRGPSTWAVSVRLPDGTVKTTVEPVPGWSEKYRSVPVVRGVAALGESLSLGYRALAWSANEQLAAEAEAEGEEVPPLSQGAVGWTMGVAMVFFSAVFLVLPALLGNAVRHRLGPVPFPAVEAAIRIGFFVGYLALISLMKDIRRVFEYHGAEHKAIAAYENGVPLTPQHAQRFTTAHVRCGTNFLLTVMVVAIVLYALVPTPNVALLIASRVVLIPVVAGLSFEVIRVAARNMQRGWVRVLMRPGLLLQRLTTREPGLDQLEVAIASLRACMTTEQLAEVDARPGAPAAAQTAAAGTTSTDTRSSWLAASLNSTPLSGGTSS